MARVELVRFKKIQRNKDFESPTIEKSFGRQTKQYNKLTVETLTS